MNAADRKLEEQIESARAAMTRSRTREDRLTFFEHMRRLIRLRSPAQVKRMEKELGLEGGHE